MTLDKLGKQAEFWCMLLGVDQNWDVEIALGDTANLAGCAGKNDISAEYQRSRILIAPGEPEETLVHEILHIIFDGHRVITDSTYDPVYELGLNKVARALVELKSKKKNGKNRSAGSSKIQDTGKHTISKTRNSSSTSRSPKAA